jgi:hypothetical protein
MPQPAKHSLGAEQLVMILKRHSQHSHVLGVTVMQRSWHAHASHSKLRNQNQTEENDDLRPIFRQLGIHNKT